MENPVPWKRLWLRLDTDARNESPGDGFLQCWQDAFGFRSTDDPKPLDKFLDLRCLVLCGEPGMGKTTALELHRPQIEAKARENGSLYWRSFREVFNPELLLHDLKGSGEWVDWLAGKNLTLVIDGVDEGLLLAINVVSGLTAELRGKPVERLRLILVCRDAEWPEAEGRALQELWPAGQAARFQLQRLCYSDAEQAARHWGLSEDDVRHFIQEVETKAIEAFAARPITLQMLVEEFKEDRQLAGTRSEIFRRGCLRLCREDARRAKAVRKATASAFTSEDLLPVAKQAVAGMLLGRYSAVSAQPPERRPAHHLDSEKLVPPGSDQRERARIEAALGSALFCDAGTQARTFALQSYTEFLAAEYLAGFPLAQVLDLLCIHEGGERFIVPQLAEVAAWLALQHSDFLDWLIAHEPEVLLRNDASGLVESQRARLVEALLSRMAREETFDDLYLKRFYDSYRHRGLQAQLKPYLINRTCSPVVRRAAIHLAGLGRLTELYGDLLEVVRNQSEEMPLREQAMNAVGRLVPTERLADLEAFARREVGPDPCDELRGVALKALVPRRWKVSQALVALKSPWNDNFIGEFRLVCSNHLPVNVEVEDLPALLSALAGIQHPFEGYHNRVRPLAERALAVAAQHLDVPAVADAFVGLVRGKLRTQELPSGLNDSEWTEGVQRNPDARHAIATVFIESGGMTAQELGLLLWHRFIPVLRDDCEWVLKRLQSASATHRPLWARLACTFWPNIACTSQQEMFFQACEDFAELAAEVHWPCSTALDSEEAHYLRQAFELTQRNEEAQRNRPAKPTADQLFTAALEAAIGDSRQWPRLALELQRQEDGRQIHGVSEDPTKKHRWQVASPAQRGQVLLCARAFLRDAQPYGETDDSGRALHVFWALWLVREQLPTDEPLKSLVITKWFDALFAQPFHGTSEEQKLTALAVSLDCSRASASLRERLEWTPSGKSSVANVLNAFESVWMPEFTPVLLGFLRSKSITGLPLRSAVEFLARHDATSAQSWLDEQFRTASPDRANVIALGLVLFPNKFWATAKSQLAADADLAVTSLQNLADLHASLPHRPLERLPAEQLSDLFLLLEATFPTAGSVKLSEGEVSPREQIEKLRQFVPKLLEGLASAESCRELLRLADAVPRWRTTLRWRWRDARLALLRRAWPGVPIEVIAGMAAKRESRWVRSNDDLLELVMDSLQRFQDELNRTEYPIVRRLWNESPSLSPKDESALTHEIIRWLRDDLGTKNGVALGCQIKPSPIHQTDIEVRATSGGPTLPDGDFVVTIEVKRDFNPEVTTSLEKQLVAEYLLKLGRTHGIYVVGWYKGIDWRKRRNPLGAKTSAEANAAVNDLLQAARQAHPGLKLEAVCFNCEFPQAFRERRLPS